MRSLPPVAYVLLTAALTASAQTGGGGGHRAPARPRVVIPDTTPDTTIFLSGKVVVDDGTDLGGSADILTVCKNQRRIETHTDIHGAFSFQFGGRSANSSDGEYEVDTSSRRSSQGRTERRDLRGCDLQASLAGFTSDSLPLDGLSGESSMDLGRIVLHRMAHVEGFTISATSAEAPKDARKALEKGQEQQKKSKWDDAQQSFEKAVAIYPRYAVAWFELGSVQIRKNDLAAARHSFEQSLAADSKYINPYHGLTQLALQAQNWKELADFSEKLLALNPVSFPQAWLSNSIGNYYLRNFAVAETSARRGLQVDAEHRVAKLEYLLGVILIKKPDYVEAAQHLRAFQTLTNKPSEVAEAQKQLDEIARLTASVNLHTDEKQ